MRIFPIVTAVIVAAVLYLLVFERDRLMSASGDDTVQAEISEQAPPPTGPDDERVVSVVATNSFAQQIDSAVLLRGRTEAARQVDVRAETSGLIMSEPLSKGEFVQQGQLLCKIDPGARLTALREAEARLPEARARLREAQINDNAARKLSEGGYASETRVAGTEAAVEAATAGVQTAEAAVAAARQEITRLTIKAPFAGLLETNTAELGTLMQPGALCATIIQLDPIKLVGFVPETDVAKVKTGAGAGARLVSGRNVTGQVTFVSRSADPVTRTFRVEITVPNKDQSISDGQTAEIIIGADGQQAHLLPASAMTLDDTGTLGVRVVRDGRASFAPVSILRDTPQGVWVAGLDTQQDVIIVGQEYVIEGVRVNVTYQGATQ